jgi:hypothetical protein
MDLLVEECVSEPSRVREQVAEGDWVPGRSQLAVLVDDFGCSKLWPIRRISEVVRRAKMDMMKTNRKLLSGSSNVIFPCSTSCKHLHHIQVSKCELPTIITQDRVKKSHAIVAMILVVLNSANTLSGVI